MSSSHGPVSGDRAWLEGQVRSGALERRTDDLHHVLGHPATTLEQAVTALLARPVPPSA
ncbi:hypothetical protein ACFVUT_02960 [Streptomyces sp. NPDC058051]